MASRTLKEGDVDSHAHVPIRDWLPADCIGKLPYLWEYGLMKFDNRLPLETFHDENIRRIDQVSQWSTVIALYPRKPEYHDEIIRLMLRAYRRRQLILLSDYIEIEAALGQPSRKGRVPLANLTAILDTLWQNRNRSLRNAEGDRATGQQLINNILAVKLGDEGFQVLGTSGLRCMIEMFHERVQQRTLNGQRPFRHIRCWYNEVGYGLGSYAAHPDDLTRHRNIWPDNVEFVGVDTYHYWRFGTSPFDPLAPGISSERVRQEADAWQRVITRYYPGGLTVCPGDQWAPEHRNDTHAMLQSLQMAHANRATMVFIANSNYGPANYTTPIETMDAFYESLRDGPWAGLSWWVFDWPNHPTSTWGYLNGTLIHYTPDNPKGSPYPKPIQDRLRSSLIASRRRMFRNAMSRM